MLATIILFGFQVSAQSEVTAVNATTSAKPTMPLEMMVADSGFRPNTDGFSFENFSSVSSTGGNCYGFSLGAKLIYEGLNENDQLKDISNFSETRKDKLPAMHISKYTSSLLKKGKVSKITALNETVRQINAATIEDMQAKTECDDFLGGGVTIVPDKKTNQDILVFDEECRVSTTKSIQTEQEILKFICKLASLQISRVTQRPVAVLSYDDSVDLLVKSLEDGKPMMLSMEISDPDAWGHSVLAYKLTKATDDSGSYYIYLYDSNYPQEERKAVLKPTGETDEEGLPMFAFSYDVEWSVYNKLGYNELFSVYNHDKLIYNEINF